MSRRFRFGFLVGCTAVIALHVPRCFESLRGAASEEPAPAAMAALDADLGADLGAELATRLVGTEGHGP